MGFVRALCPNCGANLSVDAEATSATCTYCDTTSRFQRRTRVFQIPIPAPGPPGPVAVQRVSRVAIIIPIVMVLGVASFSAIMMQRGMQQSARSRAQPATTPGASGPVVAQAPQERWFGGAALAGDVDRDGTHDLIGIVHDKTDAHIAAFSGVNGTRLWTSERITPRSDLHGTRVAIAGETLLWADRRTGLHAFELATGARRWQIKLAEPPKYLCGDPDPARITIMTTDERWHTVALADGALGDASPLARPDERTWGQAPKLPLCRPLALNTASRVDQAVLDNDATTADGMWIGYALVDAGRRIAVGHRMPGTYVPMVAQFADKKQLAWKLDVPDGDPLEAATGAPKLVALTGDLLVVVYAREGEAAPMVTAIDAATGARRWATSVGGKNLVGHRAGLTLTPDAIVVSADGSFHVLDHAGTPRFTIGMP